MISMYAFVYHYKSATVQAANYTAGSPNDNRDDINLYHSSLSSAHAENSYLISSLHKIAQAGESDFSIFPSKSDGKPLMCIATSNVNSKPSAGDIMTAEELASALRREGHIDVVLLNQGPEWYQLENCDILLLLLPSYDFTKINREKPGLLKIAWCRNWFQTWYSHMSSGALDLIIASSDVVVKYFSGGIDFPVQCRHRCSELFGALLPRRSVVQSKPFYLATNENVFYKRVEPTLSDLPKSRSIDYIFSGNYWRSHRQIMEFSPNDKYVGHIYGKGWDHSPVNR